MHGRVFGNDRVTLAGALLRGQELKWCLIDCETLISELIWIDQVHVQVRYVQHLVENQKDMSCRRAGRRKLQLR